MPPEDQPFVMVRLLLRPGKWYENQKQVFAPFDKLVEPDDEEGELDALPIDEREQTKSFLAQSLIAVVTQVLVRKPEGRARRPAPRTATHPALAPADPHRGFVLHRRGLGFGARWSD